MITIQEKKTKEELKEFVKFPFSIYKNHPYWVPPLIVEELMSFNKDVNPVFEYAEATFYMAYRDGKAVGRVAAIVNWNEINDLNKKKVRFGWFDVIDDIDVTKALLAKVEELGHKHNLDNIEGPMGFSNLDKVGALIYGFDQMSTMITWYNHEYYIDHFKQLGFTKEKEFVESRFVFPNEQQVAPYLKGDALIRKRYNLKVYNPKTIAEVMPFIDPMFDLFNDAYAKLTSFVGISDRQKQFFKDKYIDMVNPEFLKFIEDENGKMIAFSICMPSLTKALKDSNGALWPFGWLRLWWAKKHTDEVLFYLIGVDPEWQNKGLTAIIMAEYFRSFKSNGIKYCVRTPELEENNAIHNLWKFFNSPVTKRRATFIKDL